MFRYEVLCMYDVGKHSVVLENETRLVSIYGPATKWWHSGMCIHWENTLRSPEHRITRMLSSIHPRIWSGSVSVMCQALEAHKNLVGRRRIWKMKRGKSDYDANSRLHLETLLHLEPWNKHIHGLQLFQFTTISLVLLTNTNTLNRKCHFKSGTFQIRRH